MISIPCPITQDEKKKSIQQGTHPRSKSKAFSFMTTI